MTGARREGTSGPVVGRLPARLTASAQLTIAHQNGVATTQQLQTWGLSRSMVARRVATGEWQLLFRGVVLLHSGAITWHEKARGALLFAGEGAALSHRSAAFLHGIVKHPGSALVVSIPDRRVVTTQPGLTVHRRQVQPWAGGRLRAVGVDETVLDLVRELRSEDEVVALVSDAVRQGVLPGRVLLQAGRRDRLRHRRLLVDLLGDTDRGIESPLEHRYERDVERRHGLPVARTQVRHRIDDRWIRADRVYVALGVRVELDGQLAHPFGRTDEDTWRDNAVVIEHSELTLRYRWRHVVVQPCATATQVAAALRSRGWPGRLRPCSDTCTARTA
ncbi:hypothetical protein ASE38_04640 [Cellulomonas sp. Root930]|nr:hypothetical protein ASE38_04640 [Cellulomonas sp. Root930]